MRITEAGLFGFGTTTPTVKYDFVGNMNVDGLFTVKGKANFDSAHVKELRVGDSSIVVGGNYIASYYYIYCQNHDLSIQSPPANSSWNTYINSGTAGIVNSGKVGIGLNTAATPASKLHIYSANGEVFRTECDALNIASPKITAWRMFAGSAEVGKIYNHYSRPDDMNIQASAVSGNISFRTGTGSSTSLGTGRMYIRGADGYIGIGTDDPDHRLEVDFGDVLVKGADNFAMLNSEANLFLGTKDYYIKSIRGYGFKFGHTNANNLLTVKINGNVGINTDAPAAKLDINGNIKITDGTQGAGKVLTSDANGLATWTALNPMLVTSACTLQYTVPKMNSSTEISCSQLYDDGNAIGAGTATPSAKTKLHVFGYGVKNDDYSAEFIENIATTTLNKLKVGLEIQSYGDWGGPSRETNNYGLYVSEVSGAKFNYDAIFNGGCNVGIGTEIPQTKLTVSSTNDDVLFLSKNTGNAGDNVFIDFSNFINASHPAASKAKIGLNVNANGNGELVFWTRDASSLTEKVRIDENGNVGIGFVNPVQKLSVKGDSYFDGNVGIGINVPSIKLHVKENSTDFAAFIENTNDLGKGLKIKAGNGSSASTNYALIDIVDNSGYPIFRVDGKTQKTYMRGFESTIFNFPDFVFEEGYNLMPLMEKKKYWEENKHLPGIPPAREIAIKVDIPELIAKQMKEIEELYLYLIEFKKENDLLKKRIEILEKK